MGCIYDDIKNNTKTLTKLEELLETINGRQGLVIGGDYNVIVKPQLDKHGYDTPHLRTKAVKDHNDWKPQESLLIFIERSKKGQRHYLCSRHRTQQRKSQARKKIG